MATDNIELTHEDRLKAIAYNFVKLYDRWSEDRLVAAKQGADTAELVNQLTAQVTRFETVEPAVREHLRASIQQATATVAKTVADETTKAAVRATADIVQELKNTVRQTEHTLTRYQTDVITTQWKIIGTTMLTIVLTCLLIVWLLIPTPALPLTDTQLMYLADGRMMERVWPHLSKPEQQHWLQLADNIQAADRRAEYAASE